MVSMVWKDVAIGFTVAAMLYDNGVAFAGIMAFVFGDLVVLPVPRIQGRYGGWRCALDHTAVRNGVCLVATVGFWLRAREGWHGGLRAEPVLASPALPALAWLGVGLGVGLGVADFGA